MPKIAAEYVEIEKLNPWQKNPRKNDHAIEEVAESIKRFGFSSPIIARKEDGTIIAGHTRFKAAQHLGLKEVPVRYMDLDVVDSQLLAIADNKLNERADWDDELLEQVLSELADEDLSGLGFDDAELDKLITDTKEFTEEEPPEELPDDYIPISQEGEIYQLGEHRLMCGDSTLKENWDLLIEGEEYDIHTDPPYGIGANKMTLGDGKKDFYRGDDWDKEIPCLDLIIKSDCKKVLWGGNYYCHQLPQNNDWFCWWKKINGLSFSDFELAWTNIGKNCRHISHHWSGEVKIHPTQKPLPVVEWAVSFLGDVIFDPFGGSGSTLIAAAKTGRKARLIELDPRYCDAIRRRWASFARENNLEIGDGLE